jgi:hypothetical protein
MDQQNNGISRHYTNPQIEWPAAAQSLRAMDMIFHRWSMSVFQA